MPNPNSPQRMFSKLLMTSMPLPDELPDSRNHQRPHRIPMIWEVVSDGGSGEMAMTVWEVGWSLVKWAENE